MRKKERYQAIIDWFIEHNPEAKTELNYSDPFGLLVAVILSAQCTDKRVNMITPALLEAYPDAAAMAAASEEEILHYIRTCSYPNNKAKHLLGMAQALHKDYDGIVPDEVSELVQLPGVGRKTANVIASVVFNKPAMAVDTHVFRVANRLGLTNNSRSPLETELELVKHIPEELIARAHHWLILHGRYICLARKPRCADCGIAPYCKHFAKENKAPKA